MSKQPWVVIPEAMTAAHEYYDMEKTWPAEKWARLQAVKRK
jgi:hypothetical protein